MSGSAATTQLTSQARPKYTCQAKYGSTDETFESSAMVQPIIYHLPDFPSQSFPSSVSKHLKPHSHTHTITHTLAHTHIHTHTHSHTHTHTHTHTYTHTHTQTLTHAHTLHIHIHFYLK